MESFLILLYEDSAHLSFPSSLLFFFVVLLFYP
jgi:hypothetical protein